MVTDEGKPRAIDIFSADGASARNPSAPPSASANVARAGQGLPPAEFSNRNAVPPLPGRSTAIVVDHRNEGWDGVRWSRENVLDVIKSGMPDERIALYAIGPEGLVLVQDYTTDRELLLKSMREYIPGWVTVPPGAISRGILQTFGRGIDTPVAVGPAERQSPEITYARSVRDTINSLARPDEQPYEDTVEDVRLSLRALAEHLALLPGRKSVFWVSAGFRPRTMAGRRWRESEDWQKTITALNEADIAVNVIDTIDDPGSVWDQNRLVMRQIADETGARVWSARSDQALSEGIEDSRSIYTLGFYLPEGDRDGKFHALRLKVNRPGLQLSYRQGYYAGATDMPDPVTEKGRTAETLETALLNQVDSRAIGITALVDVTPGNPRATVNFRLNLDPGTLSLKEQNGGWRGNVEEIFVELNEQGRTLAKVSDKKVFEFVSGNRSDYESRGITWPLSGPLVESATKITIVIRDTNSGRVGSLTVPLQ
jgi:VWFA-related protein